MPTLAELTVVFRSKNAGPFLITVDLMFGDGTTYQRVRRSPTLTAEAVASRYGLEPSVVRIVCFDAVNTIKITLPRWNVSSGVPGDTDVYGAQQHGPVLDLEIS